MKIIKGNIILHAQDLTSSSYIEEKSGRKVINICVGISQYGKPIIMFIDIEKLFAKKAHNFAANCSRIKNYSKDDYYNKSKKERNILTKKKKL